MSIPEDGRPAETDITLGQWDELLSGFVAALDRFVRLAGVYPKDWERLADAKQYYGFDDVDKLEACITPTALPGNLELLVRQAAEAMAAAWVGLDPQDSILADQPDNILTGLRWARHVMYQVFPRWRFKSTIVEDRKHGRRLLSYVPSEKWPTMGYRLNMRELEGFKGALALLKLPKAAELASKFKEESRGILEYGPVRLLGQGKPVHVFDRHKGTLGEERYSVIEALVKAGTEGLKLEQLEAESCTSARRIVRDMKDADPDWNAVLTPPGGRGKGGYRIDKDAEDPQSIHNGPRP